MSKKNPFENNSQQGEFGEYLYIKLIDNILEWVQKKNLKIISSIILLIIFGILAQLGIIPKLIT